MRGTGVTMTQEPGLLQAVLANPDDDATRLVYADWLEEHGQGEADRARSDFIRLQIIGDTLVVNQNGDQPVYYPLEQIHSISIDGLGGDDVLSMGDGVPAASVNVDGGDGGLTIMGDSPDSTSQLSILLSNGGFVGFVGAILLTLIAQWLWRRHRKGRSANRSTNPS